MSMGKTSYSVWKRYQDKVSTQLAVRVPKDLADAFKTKCAEMGISQAQVIKTALQNFLENN